MHIMASHITSEAQNTMQSEEVTVVFMIANPHPHTMVPHPLTQA